MIRLLVFVAVVLGPPAAYLALLAIRSRLRRRRAKRNRPKILVHELAARLERERLAEADRTDGVRNRQSGLPAGWVWPDRDVDLTTAPVGPPRPRPYVRRVKPFSYFDLPPEKDPQKL